MDSIISDLRISRGMVTQLKIRATRLETGDTPLGWKVGFGAPAAMEKLAIQTPLLGFLTESARITSSATVAIADFQQAVVEPEIAVYMGADLPAGADEKTVRTAIAGLGPALELADVTFAPDDVERILAGNIYQRGVILGDKDTERAGANLDGLSVHLSKNGTEIAQTDDIQANTGNITDIIRLVADYLTGFNLSLGAGDVVIAGSIVPPVFVSGPCRVDFTLSPFDSISVCFA
ncbi:fumarylacetoacetate hydrolase family protein [Pseudomonadota bacterium]